MTKVVTVKERLWKHDSKVSRHD